MTRLEKLFKNIPILILGIAVLILVFFDTTDNYLEIVAIVLIMIYLVINLYHDWRNRKYITSTLIIIVDFIVIIAFISLCYFNYKRIDTTNFDLLWKRSQNIYLISITSSLMSLATQFLKGDRFLK